MSVLKVFFFLQLPLCFHFLIRIPSKELLKHCQELGSVSNTVYHKQGKCTLPRVKNTIKYCKISYTSQKYKIKNLEIELELRIFKESVRIGNSRSSSCHFRKH